MGTPYAELHCHSNFSFLDGASHPDELIVESARLGLSAVALTDHNGLYGVVRFAQAAAMLGVPPVFGAELNLIETRDQGPAQDRTGVPDPVGTHLVVLARDPKGYANLSRVISEAHMAGGEKGRPTLTLLDLERAPGGHWLVLTGCRKGAVPRAMASEGPSSAARELNRLIRAFGRENVAVELWDHGDPIDTARNDALAGLAVRAGVDFVATNNVHYATPARRPLATTLAAVRAGRPLAELEGWLPAAATACLRSGAEQERRFARWPGAVARAAELGLSCSFDLHLVAPGLPDCRVPPGHSEQSWLTELTGRGALERYGPRGNERVEGAWAQIDHELSVIGALGYAGYFLIVWDIVEFCRSNNIYCQGRGSAANSAVCFALGITRADAVGLGLLFERFLSPERDGPPDIDIDIESGRREEVMNYVYERYGRSCAAQVANVITYRSSSAVRDVGKALGCPQGQIEGWAKSVDDGSLGDRSQRHPELPSAVARIASEILGFPRHLGLHPGGMVLCDRPVIEVCPVEWARHEGRSVLQWDKDDCANAGLVKFDLLGLGMLEALHRTVDLIGDFYGVDLDLAMIDQEEAVYDMLCRADTIGVFQVESRAQMATLPRIKPRTFDDLVIEVAIIRPGPIQGGSVHPFIRRRQGLEAADPPHPLLKKALKKTLGVPLFQEQLMQIAIDSAGFSPAESDELRQAMSAKRSGARMAKLRERLFSGMAERGITGEVAEEIFEKLAAFANFGFPESHAVSFAYLVYSSAWLKLHYPAAFCAGLLNSQPMGFWSPQSLVADARRHGIVVHRPHVDVSRAEAALEWPGETPSHRSSCTPGRRSERRPRTGPSQPDVRLGISYVRHIGTELAEKIAGHSPYSSMEDLVRRVGVNRVQLEALATAGALEGLPPIDGAHPPTEDGAHPPTEDGAHPPSSEHFLGGRSDTRRISLWAAGPVSEAGRDRLPGLVVGEEAPRLPELGALEEASADVWATGLTVAATAVELARERLDSMGVTRAGLLLGAETDGKVTVAGVVTHRQHPESAKGTVFLNLEDETGMVNVICSPGGWERWRHVARRSPALVVRGRLERTDGTVSVVAEKFTPLDLGAPVPASRDFR